MWTDKCEVVFCGRISKLRATSRGDTPAQARDKFRSSASAGRQLRESYTYALSSTACAHFFVHFYQGMHLETTSLVGGYLRNFRSVL